MPKCEWDDPIPEDKGPEPLLTIPISGIFNWWKRRKAKENEEYKRKEENYRRVFKNGKGDIDFQCDSIGSKDPI